MRVTGDEKGPPPLGTPDRVVYDRLFRRVVRAADEEGFDLANLDQSNPCQ